MVARKPKGLDDRISKGIITRSSTDVFEIETHRTINNPHYTKKEEYEKFFFSRINARRFVSRPTGSEVRILFNNQYKELIEKIYDSRWNVIYSI